MPVEEIPYTPSMAGVRGKHRYKVHTGTVFTIDIKYELEELLGRGGYGSVCSAVNIENEEKVAIKRIEGPQHLPEDLSTWRDIFRELTLLGQVDHPFIVRVKEIMKPWGTERTFTEVYVVFELLPTDFSKLVHRFGPLGDSEAKLVLNQLSQTDFSKLVQQFGPLDGSDGKLVVNQLLRALKYLHSGNVLHRDLKTSNVLVDRHMRVKLCDFGLARVIPESGQHMTRQPGSILYMAPELLLYCNQYTAAVDIWSLACIFVRLVYGNFLFDGRTAPDQLLEIADVIPIPQTEDLDFVEDPKCRTFLDNLPDPTSSLEEKCPGMDPDALDLLKKMFVFDPRKRITAAEALRHPYMADITIDELGEKLKLKPSEIDFLKEDVSLQIDFDRDDFTNTTLTEELERAKVYREISLYDRPKIKIDAASASTSLKHFTEAVMTNPTERMKSKHVVIYQKSDGSDDSDAQSSLSVQHLL